MCNNKYKNGYGSIVGKFLQNYSLNKIYIYMY